ncbi:SLOG family protein [Raoultella terrigena]|uniref:SLOG family protein n=1 Tax=Raoultella terrigena TaxID=577 RepID=UPI001C4C77B8|nr:SLOG family protein [Raoultella terrigena]
MNILSRKTTLRYRTVRVLICSGRFYADTHTLTHVLDLYARTQIIDVLIHGGHQTLGSAIETWARGIDVHVIRYPANWMLHGKYAETKRNLFMLEDSRPDVLLAFSGGEDTAECIKMAQRAGIQVIEV